MVITLITVLTFITNAGEVKNRAFTNPVACSKALGELKDVRFAGCASGVTVEAVDG